MKKLCVFLAIVGLVFVFGATMAIAKEKQPKVFKLGFISGLSGPLAHVTGTQKNAVALLVEPAPGPDHQPHAQQGTECAEQYPKHRCGHDPSPALADLAL